LMDFLQLTIDAFLRKERRALWVGDSDEEAIGFDAD